MIKLTESQKRVLSYLSDHNSASSATLGIAACGEFKYGTENSKHPVPRSPQGAGRIVGGLSLLGSVNRDFFDGAPFLDTVLIRSHP